MADPGRIGIDVGEKLPLEDAVAWAARNRRAHHRCAARRRRNAFTGSTPRAPAGSATVRAARHPPWPAHVVRGQCRGTGAAGGRRGRCVSESLRRCRRHARRRLDRGARGLSLQFECDPAHGGRPGTAAPRRGLCRNQKHPPAAGEPEQGTARRRGPLSGAHDRGMALVLRKDPVARFRAIVHRQPRASGAGRRRGISRGDPARSGRRSAARRLLSQRQGRAFAAGPGRFRLSRIVPCVDTRAATKVITRMRLVRWTICCWRAPNSPGC